MLYAFAARRILEPMANTASDVSIKKYGRFWAVFLGGELLALTVYKKGANSVKTAIGELSAKLISSKQSSPASCRLRLKDIAGWTSQEFQRHFLSGVGLCDWKMLRSEDMDAAMKIASKMLPETVYVWFAFVSLSQAEKDQILKAFAQGELPNEFWPIVPNSFVDALVRTRDLKISTLETKPFANGFARLSPSQKQITHERISCQITWQMESFTLSRTNPPAEVDSSLVNFGTMLANRDLHVFLHETVGQIGFYYFCPQMDELRETIAAFGGCGPLWYYLTLDFTTGAENATSLRKDPWEFNADLLPKPNYENNEKHWIAKKLLTPPRKEPVFDYLGTYFWDEQVGPHIVLRIQRIAAAADDIGVEFERLLVLAWVHQFAHLIHLGIPDADGLFNPPKSNLFVEIMAQWATWKTVEMNPYLLQAFFALSRNQGEAQRAWKTIQNFTKQEISWFLWCLRAKRRGFNRAELEKRLVARFQGGQQ